MKWRFDWPVNWGERGDPIGDIDRRHGAMGRCLGLAGGKIRLLNWCARQPLRSGIANSRTAPVGGHRGRKPLGGGLLPRGGLGSREQTIMYGSRPWFRVRPRNAVKLGAGIYRQENGPGLRRTGAIGPPSRARIMEWWNVVSECCPYCAFSHAKRK